ncbi:MAG TPA: hypothetical protein PLG43_02840 [Spirochaetia bacterium]|nr:hypothetical protein [Spirochaetia bacterium]
MNERQKRLYLKEKYDFKIGCQDDLDKIADLDDEILAIDLELRACARAEREAVRSGRMTWEEIYKGQLKTWREVYREELEKTNVR